MRALLACTAVVLVLGGCQSVSSNPPPPPSSSPSSGPTSAAAPNPQDPARFAPQVRKYAQAASVNPTLLMAILYNESDKPHDPATERAWQKLKPDAAFGIANMHKAAFEDTRKGRDFANREWQELPDDPTLAIDAAAWFLHDLAAQLPARTTGPYTRDELLGLGYDAGAGSMKAFARGEKPGSVAQNYLDRLRANMPTAEQAMRHG